MIFDWYCHIWFDELGRNAFTGALESFYVEPLVTPPNEEDCQNFPNPFNGNPITNPFSKIFRKIRFSAIKKYIVATEDERPAALETLILCEFLKQCMKSHNTFRLYSLKILLILLFTILVDENNLTGTIPFEWTLLTNLVDVNVGKN